MNTSITSTATSSSKAVLAALRALQDKIRRLETERSLALDESSQLKLQLKNQEIEAEHAKQKEQLMAQKSVQEMKTAYDRLLEEKSELEVKLARYEEKNRALQHQSDELSIKIRSIEEEKHRELLRLKEYEHEQFQLQQSIKIAQQKEKGNKLTTSLYI